MEFFQEYILPHWPFVVFALIAAVVVQVVKSTIWTKAHADKKGRWQWFYWWGRKTLALHPVAAGALIGLIPGMPVSLDGAASMAGHACYYAAAGLVSCWAFDVVKALAKKRGIELTGVTNGDGK